MMGKVNQSGNVLQLQLQHAAAIKERGSGFDSVLREHLNKTSGVQFSKHAAARVEQRRIEVTGSFMEHLNQAVEKAQDKGAKNVVIISDRGAFIINVPNKTVVTTMSNQEMKENIFTNIDSAVLL